MVVVSCLFHLTFYYKMRQISLQNVIAILLPNTTIFSQNGTVITKFSGTWLNHLIVFSFQNSVKHFLGYFNQS